VKFCPRHDEVAHNDLSVRGLAALIDTDEERMMLSIADAHHCGLTFDNFNPYAQLVSDIFHAVMGMFESEAIELMVADGKELGLEECPVCFLDSHCLSRCGDHDKIIHYLANRQVEKWRTLPQ
jgi:hypothetical protein